MSVEDRSLTRVGTLRLKQVASFIQETQEGGANVHNTPE